MAIDPIQYAQFAANSYAASSGVVHEKNEIPIPAGWSIFETRRIDATGFLARAYQHTTTKEIVISYGGTTYEDGLATRDWFTGNLPGASGLALGEQVVDAAKFYLDVRADQAQKNPDAPITFTGHSLGGGLASLMAVYFGRTASTFDPAPFALSAKSSGVVSGLKTRLKKMGYTLPAEFETFDVATGLSSRQSLVSQTYLKGEALQYIGSNNPVLAAIALSALGGPALGTLGLAAGAFVSQIAGTTTPVDAGDIPILDAVKAHYMPLLVAAMQSPKFKDASKANPELLQQIFSSKLFSVATQDKPQHNLLNLMVQQQAAGNGALDVLADDLAKFTGELADTSSVANVKAAMYAFALAMHYGQGEDRTIAPKLFDPLFDTDAISGGLQFTPDPAQSQFYSDSFSALRSVLGTAMASASEFIGKDADRYTLPTFGSMNVAAKNDDKRDLMIGSDFDDTLLAGGGGNDILVGRTGVDRLDGGAGVDTLYGGFGDDILVGGTGDDLYIYYNGDGADTIIEEKDADGKYHGRIRVDYADKPIDLRGLFVETVKDSHNYQWAAPGGATVTLTHNSPWTLNLADGGSIQLGETQDDFQSGDFGLRLYEEAAAVTYDKTIVGDLAPVSTELKKDELGNVIVNPDQAEPNRADALQDSVGNDDISGLGGNDFLWAWRGGQDKIDGGAGDDYVIGGAGASKLIGGAGSDILRAGGAGNRLYGEAEVTMNDELAAQGAAGTGARGDLFDGGGADNVMFGGAGNDVMSGGGGASVIIGGGGNDDIHGDLQLTAIGQNWAVARSVTDGVYSSTYNDMGYVDYAPAAGGDDVIYAGGGEDWVNGSAGADFIDGGADNDVVFGGTGNDSAFGGTGDDIINAQTGDDFVDGQDGNDNLAGSDGNDSVFGGAGDDIESGGIGDDTVDGGVGADSLYGGDGNDAMDGGDGADMLSANAGDDILAGGTGADQLFGGEGSDSMAGDADNDVLSGGTGDDKVAGGDGDDQVFGGAGNDIVTGGNGADFLQGDSGDGVGDGNDTLDGGDGNDTLLGLGGDDQLAGGGGNDQLQGNAGNDGLSAGDGNDTVFGDSGNDTIDSGAGDDYVLGGSGNDTLQGGEGNDVYFYTSGEGSDRISDSGGTDYLVFTDILWGQVVLGVGSLKLTLPDGAELHLDDFDPDNPYAAGGIEWFQFADNTVLSKTQLINALGIKPTGTPGDDDLSGTSLSETIQALAGDDIVDARAGNDMVYAADGADVVYGGDGNDTIYGGNGDDALFGENGNDTVYGDAGNDFLSGGAGTDQLLGGDGNDTYLFQLGDGQDTVTDALGSNGVALGAGLTLDAIRFVHAGNDLQVVVKATGDQLTIKDWYAADSHFASITLGDGLTLDHAGVEANLPKNQAPLATPDAATVTEDSATYVSGNALANDSDPEGSALRVTNPGSYLGTVGSLSLDSNGAYGYSLANNTTAVQSLAAGQSLTESFAYSISDDDPVGAATAASTITITVLGSNDLPLLGTDNAATAEDAAPISDNVLTNDSDIDSGTVLTVADAGARTGAYGSLTLGSSGAWGYSLNNAASTVQSLAAGQSVTDNFTFNVSDGIAQVGGKLAISIAGQNDAPIVVTALADQAATANKSWTWQVPAGSFADVDAGDVLSYGATLADGAALPSWLTFDSTTLTFSGRVPRTATGNIDIRVTANDRLAASASDVFNLSFDGSTSGGGGGGGGGGGNGGGGSQGNEGVGNGVDGPPPGHDTSFNDGPGTGPGNPGAQGGNGYVPPRLADILMTRVNIATPILDEQGPQAAQGNSAVALAAAPGQIKQNVVGASASVQQADIVADQSGVSPAPTFTAGASDSSNGNGGNPHAAADNSSSTVLDATTSAPQGNAYGYSIPNLGQLLADVNAWEQAQGNGNGQSVSASDAEVFAQWLAMEQALADFLAHAGDGGWFNGNLGANANVLNTAAQGFLGSNLANGNDPLAQLASLGSQLKVFQGLGNGVGKIG